MSLAGGSVYPAAVDAFLRGDIDVMTATVRAQLVSGFAYDAAHTSAADITAPLGDPAYVSVVDVSGGALWVAPVTFSGVPAGLLTAVVVYVEDGPLLCHVDRRADTVPISRTTTGGPIKLTFGRLLKL